LLDQLLDPEPESEPVFIPVPEPAPVIGPSSDITATLSLVNSINASKTASLTSY
jgi:hypothetical protein